MFLTLEDYVILRNKKYKMSNRSYTKWREENREYWRQYKKAWNRLMRNNPKYPPEFPDGRIDRVIRKRKDVYVDKHLVMRDLGNGFCRNCESKSKDYFCDYCLKTFPQLLEK